MQFVLTTAATSHGTPGTFCAFGKVVVVAVGGVVDEPVGGNALAPAVPPVVTPGLFVAVVGVVTPGLVGATGALALSWRH